LAEKELAFAVKSAFKVEFGLNGWLSVDKLECRTRLICYFFLMKISFADVPLLFFARIFFY